VTLKTWVLVALLVVGVSVSGQTPPAGRQGAAGQGRQGGGPAAAAKPKFKAIWERVAYTKDINLEAVACVAADECWAAGRKGTIVHTTDGGKTWEAQLGGDPDAISEDDFFHLFFLDRTHGWAVTRRGKILGTTNGSSWAELSTVSGTGKGVWFVSPQQGFQIENPDSTSQTTLRVSNDGGKSWKAVSRCSLELTVDGLPRKLGCFMRTAQFLSPTVGFMGGASGDITVFGKTSDGGQTWTMSAVPGAKRDITSIHFWSPNDGIVVLDGGEEVHWTADGGATWTRSTSSRLWPAYYGVGAGKIIVGANEGNRGMGYSFDGGRSFTVRPFAAPASVRAVTFFDAANGMLVGDHAMAYKYRIVPVDYSSPGMIAAAAP
jgi:photosystem II stability/assembly factor-like uncharacterized protein